MIHLQRPKAEKTARVLAFRDSKPATNPDAEIADLVALRSAWSTGLSCIGLRLAELETAKREKGKRRAR